MTIDANTPSETPATAPTLHFVVTCMGRREMIRQTIDHALAQPGSTYTLVDYSCPEHTGEWVREKYPDAHVVFVKDRTSWHASEARNLGAQTIRDGWICFVDADTILRPGFSQEVLAAAKPGTFLAFDWQDSWLIGLLICRQEDFVRCGGYDQFIRDWGYEDVDLRRSLARLGLRMETIPRGLAESIAHDETLRLQYCQIQDKELSVRANGFYSLVKDTLLTQGIDLPTERLRTFYQYVRERVLAGYPWLTWPDGEIEPASFMRFIRHVLALSEGYRSIEAETWGPVRLFRITRERDSIVELLSTHNRHQVAVRAPGQTRLTTVSLYGDKKTLPVHDGECELVLKAEPIFTSADVSLIKDVAIELAPAPGPGLAVELTSGPDCDAGPLRFSLALDGELIDKRDAIAGAGAQRFDIPLPPLSLEGRGVGGEGLERPRNAEVTLTAGGRTQVAMRRTTFLCAAHVTGEEATQVTPPEHVYRHTMVDSVSLSACGEGRGGVNSDTAFDVGWGWTETDLVCWIARRAGMPSAECVANILIDAENVKSPHYGGALEMRSQLGPAPEVRPLEYQQWFGDSYWVAIDGAVSSEANGAGLGAVLRLPFDVIGIAPVAGNSLGITLTITDTDDQGAKRLLAWGAGTGLTRNPRLYNEITLSK